MPGIAVSIPRPERPKRQPQRPKRPASHLIRLSICPGKYTIHTIHHFIRQKKEIFLSNQSFHLSEEIHHPPDPSFHPSEERDLPLKPIIPSIKRKYTIPPIHHFIRQKKEITCLIKFSICLKKDIFCLKKHIICLKKDITFQKKDIFQPPIR